MQATTGSTGDETSKGGRLARLIGAVLAASLALAPMNATTAREVRSERAAPPAALQSQGEKPAEVAAESAADPLTSKGKDFYLAFPNGLWSDTFVYWDGPRTVTGANRLLFWVTGDEATEGYVSSSAGLFAPIKYTLTPGQAISIVVPGEISGTAHAHAATEGVSDRSIRVTATADVSVYGLSYEAFNTDGFMAIPTKSLGREYVVAAYNSSSSSYKASGPQIVATEDNTLITVTWQITSARVSPFIDPAIGFYYNMTFSNALTDVVYLSELDATPPVSTMVLNAGEVFAHYVYTDDVSGSIVEASKPILVMGWRNIALVPDGYPAGDQLLESMPPTASWGRNYVAMPTAGRTWGDTFRIYGAQSNTEVFANGRKLGTIGRGQWIEHRTEKVETKVFTATRPIMVQQYMNGQMLDRKPGDPSMLTVTPLEQGLSRYTIATPQYLPQPVYQYMSSDAEFTNTLNIVAPEVAGVQIYVDGARVNGMVSSGMGFLTATVAITPGSHVATGTLPFVMSVTGVRNAESYAYPAGSSYQRLSSVSSLTLSPNSGTFLVADGERCFVATVANDDSSPAAGLAVYLYGPNGRVVASATAGADGKATLCYTGTAGDVGVTAVAGLLSVNADIRWSDGSTSSNANLSGLVIAPGTLSPAFAGGTTKYAASVPNGTTSVAVTATTSDANATVAYASSAGACSGTVKSCAVAGPKTWITATVTAQDGTTKQYSVEITVGGSSASTDASLSGLVIAPGTLSPAFVSATNNYTAIVPYGTHSVVLTATTHHAQAMVKYESSAGLCLGLPRRCAVSAPKTWITVTVTAEDGTTTEQYSITTDMVDDASLRELDVTPGTLFPVFNADTLTYTTRVTNGVSSVTVNDAISDPNATVTYQSSAGACTGTPPSCPLNPGTNTITVTVTAENGTTVREYVMEVTRADAGASSDSTPTDVAINDVPLTPAFTPDTKTYTATLPVGTTQLTVTTQVQGGQVTMVVVDENGKQSLCALSNTANCPLKPGRNVIRVSVMAEDGTVTEYVLEVTVLSNPKLYAPVVHKK